MLSGLPAPGSGSSRATVNTAESPTAARLASWGKVATAVLTAPKQLFGSRPRPMSFDTELRYRAGTPMPALPAHDTNSATQLAREFRR